MIDWADSFNPLRVNCVIGVKGILRPMSVDPEKISKLTASRAAKAASADMVKQTKANSASGGGALALYTWGAIAIVSTIAAVGVGVFPGQQDGTSDVGSTIVAQNDPQPQVSDMPVPGRNEKSVVPTTSKARDDTAPTGTELVVISEPEGLDLLTTASVKPAANEMVVANETITSQPIIPETGLGVEIGRGESVAALVHRYESLVRREPELFQSLRPRTLERADVNKHWHSLIAGPFASSTELADFCREVKLRLTISCETADYKGEKLAVASR